jgi:hypothetical protein
MHMARTEPQAIRRQPGPLAGRQSADGDVGARISWTLCMGVLFQNSTGEASFVFSAPACVLTLSWIVNCFSLDSMAQNSPVVTSRWAHGIVDWVWTFGSNPWTH